LAWLHLSESRREADFKKLEQDIEKEQEKKSKEFTQTNKKGFACEEKAGRFILATNCLDPIKLSPSQALSLYLSLYKEQQGTERGFRFIKDPLFFASSAFLKNTSRIMALAFIMALSLLVYSLTVWLDLDVLDQVVCGRCQV
jgi:transposase